MQTLDMMHVFYSLAWTFLPCPATDYFARSSQWEERSTAIGRDRHLMGYTLAIDYLEASVDDKTLEKHF